MTQWKQPAQVLSIFSRNPWDEIAFRTTKMTLEFFFADRREGRFEFHTADIA